MQLAIILLQLVFPAVVAFVPIPAGLDPVQRRSAARGRIIIAACYAVLAAVVIGFGAQIGFDTAAVTEMRNFDIAIAIYLGALLVAYAAAFKVLRVRFRAQRPRIDPRIEKA